MIYKNIVARCFYLTVLIFILGIIINYGVDFVRIDSISDSIKEHELRTESFSVETSFLETVGGNNCDVLDRNMRDLTKELRDVGSKLGSYSGFSWFNRNDFDYLKRKYFLLELRLYSLVLDLNNECAHPYAVALFFYKIDDAASENQGFVLDSLGNRYPDKLLVLSFDKDYKDEPLVSFLINQYNISDAPITIIDKNRFEGYVSEAQLTKSIDYWLNYPDPYSDNYDFNYTINAIGVNVSELSGLIEDEKFIDSWAKADAKLAVARMTGNRSMICDALPLYDRAISENTGEAKAILYETVSSLGCGRNRQAFLLEAAKVWRSLGVEWRADLIEGLAGRHLVSLKVSPYHIVPQNYTKSWNQIVIGRSEINIDKSDVIVTQVDRVERDWLGAQLNQSPYGSGVLTTFSERLKYNSSELSEEIGWHEGGRLSQMLFTNASHYPAVGALAVLKDGKWYAPDDTGAFRFEVPFDKIMYPTTRFLREDIALLIDTHGMNMIVEQSIRNNATAVIACCDHPGKIAAAKYMSDKGIDVVCFPDKYAYLALGNNVNIVGSPPVDIEGDSVVLGNRPMALHRDERIVVVNGSETPYALWYYQTPANFMSALNDVSGNGLDLHYVQLSDFNTMYLAVQKAEELNSSTIAARVFDSQDYNDLKSWLLQSSENRVILFHSSPYPYGIKLFNEFPFQTSFDDPNPIFRI